MVREEMTVHQALCELKTLEKRCQKSIRNITPIATRENAAKKVNGMDIKDFNALATENMQQANDLMNRFFAIKAEVNHYNATAMVTIAGKEYTMASAIWMMQHGMDVKKTLLQHLTSALSQATVVIERANGNDLNNRAENAAIAAVGTKDKSDPEAYLKFLTEYKSQHQLVMVDPLGIRATIKKLEAEINEFETQVDAAIQVSNATKTIVIEY